MKKFLLLFAIFLFLLSGCTRSNNLKLYDTNYNNVYSYSLFWPTEEGVFYIKNDFYNVKLYIGTSTSKRRLADNSSLDNEYLSGNMFVYDNALYLKTEDQILAEEYIFQENEDTAASSENYDQIKGEYNLYRYDLDERKFTKIIEQINQNTLYMVMDQYIVYNRCSTEDYYNHKNQLFVFDTLTGNENRIAEQVYSFGIVGDKIRYVYFTNALNVFEYDPGTGETKQLLEFSVPEFEDDLIINYTNKYVVLVSKSNSQYVVCDLDNGNVDIRDIGGMVNSFVVGDKYAFVSVSADPFKNEASIYRLQLSSGETEVVREGLVGGSFIQVASDDLVYVMTEEKNILLNKAVINKIDVTQKKMKKVLSF